MVDKKVLLGMDRYLALEWADYSLELFLSSDDVEKNYELLFLQLKKEISGFESARKTSNQLKRLWLTEKDEKQDLRSIAKEIIKTQRVVDYSIFHLGMAINVYPVFKEICNTIGRLSIGQDYLRKRVIIERVSEKYASPSSIPRLIMRVIQSLENWKFIDTEGDSIIIKNIPVDNKLIGSWFILSILLANKVNEFPISDLNTIPEKLGVNFHDIRGLIQQSKFLGIQRNSDGIEKAIINF